MARVLLAAPVPDVEAMLVSFGHEVVVLDDTVDVAEQIRGADIALPDMASVGGRRVAGIARVWRSVEG